MEGYQEMQQYRASDYRAYARVKMRDKMETLVLCFFILLLFKTSFTYSFSDVKLWYNQPAQTYPAQEQVYSRLSRVEYGYGSGNPDDYIWDRALEVFTAFFTSVPGWIYAILIAFAVLRVFIVPSLEAGSYVVTNRLIDGDKPRVSMLFSRFHVCWKLICIQIVCGVLVALQWLLLFVPGIIALYRYSMTNYLIARHPEMGVMEAIRTSKRMMRGRKWRLFCLQFSFIGWLLLCAMFTGMLGSVASAFSGAFVVIMSILCVLLSTIVQAVLASYFQTACTLFMRDAETAYTQSGE